MWLKKKKSWKSDSTNINTIQSNPILWWTASTPQSTPQLVVIVCRVVLLVLYEMIFKSDSILQSNGGLDTKIFRGGEITPPDSSKRCPSKETHL